ncbi:hypothetical protein DFA_03005 [Cavenderia fasciculata]|uniref:Uncharacterized protein n=1 Tax=Cavenderia fasciculata TaxID=261658 RepID=F4PGC7_CACFS|nr:uncharacterized protein DFA_03005 [Cavenderia fasciculata]EGG24761.1 hypothetical protein DFA_03005 [Cavenderia fasciculata]|eukprot:XP_004362612.1 hypothetical protein DFA_03005 [Cavenderia fasciculata]
MEDDGDVMIHDIDNDTSSTSTTTKKDSNENDNDNNDVVIVERDNNNNKPTTDTSTSTTTTTTTSQPKTPRRIKEDDEDDVTIVDNIELGGGGGGGEHQHPQHLNLQSPASPRSLSNDDIIEYSTKSLVSLLLVNCITKVQQYKKQQQLINNNNNSATENGDTSTLSSSSNTNTSSIEWNIVYELYIQQAKYLNQVSPYHISDGQLQIIHSSTTCKQYYTKLVSIYKDEENLESIIRKSIIDNLKISINQSTLDDISKLKNEIKILNEEIITLEDDNEKEREREREREKETMTPFSPPQQQTNVNAINVDDDVTTSTTSITTTKSSSSVPPSPIINSDVDDEASRKKEEEVARAKKAVMQSLQKRCFVIPSLEMKHPTMTGLSSIEWT